MTGRILTTERLILRPIGPEDLEAMLPFTTSDRARFVGGGADKDANHAWRILATLIGHWQINGTGPFAMVDQATGTTIGSAGPWFPLGWPEKELSWTIWDPAMEGKGLAAEAILAIRDHVYRDLGWTTATSYIDPENARSIALAERLGCTRDDRAAHPQPDEPCLVYRHPRPQS